MRYREMRLPCDTRVRLIGEDGEGAARLVNVSATGARLAGAGPLSQDAAVTLSHLGLRVAATVVWSDAGEAGLRFRRPIAATELAAFRRVVGFGATGATGPGWAGSQAFREL